MRTVIFYETSEGMSALDNEGQWVTAHHRPHQKITYTSYLMDDEAPVQMTSPCEENWRKQVAELMGF